MWYVFIIECQDGKLYTGITEDLKRRLAEHAHKGSHFTSYNQIKELKYSEESPNRLEAEKREAQIKRWSHAKKLALISGDKEWLRELSKSRE